MEELLRTFLLSLEKEVIVTYFLFVINIIMWVIPSFLSFIGYLIIVNIGLKETNRDLRTDYKILDAIQGQGKKRK